MSLDPQAKAFLRKMAEGNVPPVHEMTPGQLRCMVLPIAGEPEPVGDVANSVVPSPACDVPVRVVSPLAGDGEKPKLPKEGWPILVFFHGGGWVTGSIDSHEAVCRRLANECQSIVISVGYRLAPEHKFPAAIDDSFAATRWAYEHAEHLGGDPRQLFVSGDSAGGNLAAAVCLQARDEGGPPIQGQVLVYPITAYSFDTNSYRENATGFHLTTDMMKWFWQQYLAEETDGRNPSASPLRASSLADLPPALVITVESDPLRDEGLAYADRLAAAGVAVDRIHCPDMIHGFFRRLDAFDRASGLVAEIAEWIKGQPS